MKRIIILVLLLLLVTAPAIAQEDEPEECPGAKCPQEFEPGLCVSSVILFMAVIVGTVKKIAGA